jgi:hypothetical protein
MFRTPLAAAMLCGALSACMSLLPNIWWNIYEHFHLFVPFAYAATWLALLPPAVGRRSSRMAVRSSGWAFFLTVIVMALPFAIVMHQQTPRVLFFVQYFFVIRIATEVAAALYLAMVLRHLFANSITLRRALLFGLLAALPSVLHHIWEETIYKAGDDWIVPDSERFALWLMLYIIARVLLVTIAVIPYEKLKSRTDS